jgi:hypothetical protein
MNKYFRVVVGAVVLAALPLGCHSEPKTEEPPKPMTYEDSVSGTVSAKVKAVDQTTRALTLQDAKGDEETYYVSPTVTRLSEVKAGDTVKMDYTAKIIGELRPPTADEKAHPISVVDAGGRAPATSDPAAAAGRGIKVVTTVEAVDVPNMRVTLRGPLGDLAVVKGRKKENLQKIKVGDTIVITYVEAAAVSLVKAK